jgi:hypothetical protein
MARAVTTLSKPESIRLQPEAVVSSDTVTSEPVDTSAGDGKVEATPGTDYLWYDCSGDSLE